MTYATDLMLLLLDPKKGRPVANSPGLPLALGGAVLLELAITDSIRISGPAEAVKKGRVVPTAVKHEDPFLSDGLSALRASSPMKAQNAVSKLSKNLQPKVLAQLKRERQISEERDRVLGIFPRTKWYPRIHSRREELREDLGKVLTEGGEPSSRTSALIALLSAVDAVPKVFPEAEKKAIRKRAKEIADREWAAKAVRDAVESVQAAIMASIVAANAASSGG